MKWLISIVRRRPSGNCFPLRGMIWHHGGNFVEQRRQAIGIPWDPKWDNLGSMGIPWASPLSLFKLEGLESLRAGRLLSSRPAPRGARTWERPSERQRKQSPHDHTERFKVMFQFRSTDQDSDCGSNHLKSISKIPKYCIGDSINSMLQEHPPT